MIVREYNAHNARFVTIVDDVRETTLLRLDTESVADCLNRYLSDNRQKIGTITRQSEFYAEALASLQA